MPKANMNIETLVVSSIGFTIVAVVWLTLGLWGFLYYNHETFKSSVAGEIIISAMAMWFGPLNWVFGWFDKMPKSEDISPTLFLVGMMGGLMNFALIGEFAVRILDRAPWQVGVGVMVSAITVFLSFIGAGSTSVQKTKCAGNK